MQKYKASNQTKLVLTYEKTLNRFLFVLLALSGNASNIYAAEFQKLIVEKSHMSAKFPCTPKREKQLIAKTELGDLFTTSLSCSKSDSFYLLSMTQYPNEFYKIFSVTEWLDSTLDYARSKKYIKIKTSHIITHQKLPAIRSHILDTRKPNTTSISLAVLTQNGMVIIMATTPPALEKSKTVNNFLSSLIVEK